MTIEQTRRLELLGADISRELALVLDEMFFRIEALEAVGAADRRRARAQIRGMTEHNETLHRQVADLSARVRKLEAEARAVPLVVDLVESGPFDPRD